MKTLHDPEVTRRRILETAFQEFYRHTFQAGSLNRIVQQTGLTKGALFHHFASKMDLGYAVVDELIGPEFNAKWIEPLNHSNDPITSIKQIMRRMAEEGHAGAPLVQGCPLNNLAQEMSPLDEGFRQRLERIYAAWRLAIHTALARGIAAGKVKNDVSPSKVSALIVAGLTGIISTAKNAQDEQLLWEAGDALGDYLDSLRT
jgi:AcrR family transcriptional regulator